MKLKIHLQRKQRQLYNAIRDIRPDAPTVLGFGGARGAAKTGGVQRIALLLTESPGVIVWIIRRIWDDLNKDHVLTLWRAYPELQQYYRAQDHELRLPNGSSIFFIHSGDAGRSKRKSRGPQAHYIFLDQAEEHSQEEMEQLAGSNRAAGVAPGVCKRIYTFNPGGIGTAYLRRIFHLKEYRDYESAQDFMFIQGFGWDNYEWFRALAIVSERDFYHADECTGKPCRCGGNPAWDDKRRFDVFVEKTDFGRKLNSLPPSQRIGELMGSFENFAGQYYADIWEQKSIVLSPELVAKIVKPWWRRWLATDWGFSHFCATGWFASGIMSPEDIKACFQVDAATPVRVIVQYREAVVQDTAEPDLAKLIVSLTPESERREIRDHFMGHDAWAKHGGANTVVEQMEPILAKHGMPPLSKASIDRVGGWRLLYNCWASSRRLRNWPGPEPYAQESVDQPAFFIAANCPDTIGAIPMLMRAENDPTDVEKYPGKIEDDVADCVRYGIKSYLTANPSAPAQEELQRVFDAYKDPTSRAIMMQKAMAEQTRGQFLRRRVRG